MGLCICTFSTPISACVGGGLAASLNCVPCCVGNDQGYFTGKDKRRHLAAYATIFLVGSVGLYLPLTFKCAEADGEDWELFKGSGECWSTGGEMPFVPLGFFAGLAVGLGFAGFVVTLLWKTRELDDTDAAGRSPTEVV